MIFGGSRHTDAAAEVPPPPAEYAREAQQATGNCDIPAKGELSVQFACPSGLRAARNRYGCS
jgi:hypothetical protein